MGKYKNIFILIKLILFFTFIKNSIQTYIVYPFRKSTKEKKPYPENLLQNDLEITLEIGTPPQSIDLNLRSKVYAFHVASSELNLPFPTYNSKLSTSYFKLSKSESNFQNQEYEKGFKIYETLTINQKEVKNITLVLATKIIYNQAGALGLRLLKSHEFGGNLSFIYQVKAAANLDNYAFTLRYDNDETGELTIGSYPHLYNKNYNAKNFYISRARDLGANIDWVLDFDAIRYNNKTISGIKTKSLIQIEFGLILAPNNLKKYFNDNFFLDKCKEEIYDKRNITIIHCDKNLDITQFKNLSFILKDIDYEFVLTYNDLFVEENNEYIFGIVFDNRLTTTETCWILGKPFMKKYELVYDLDRKIIGLYKDKKDSGKNGKFKFNIYIFMLIILVLVVIGLGVYIIYYLKKPRKSRAFELDDDNFDYSPSK